MVVVEWGSRENVQGYFRQLPSTSVLVLIHLNMLKQVPNPLLGLALALALILASIKQLRDSHLRWFITSVDGYPFFLFLYMAILTW
jgi:hypothetical protein